MTEFVPVNEPLLSGRELEYLSECIRSGWISSEGPFVARLESELAARVGRAHGIAVANGSAALDIAVAALKLGPGDEVILPTFTIISCAAAVIRSGATPVTVDCDAATWNMDVSQVEAAITPRTKAIMAVHIYGLPVDMDAVLDIALRHNLAVIEDAAEAIGLNYRDRPCGGFGTISTFSFYPNKHITTGEGGMVLTDDALLADRCRSLRNLCFEPSQRFLHRELGWNYRISNLQAAVGLAQLERLDEHLLLKRAAGRRYDAALSELSNVQLPLPKNADAENLYWVYGLVLDDAVPFDASGAMRQLHSTGVGTRPFFWPMHKQPVLRDLGLFEEVHHPVAERISKRGFYLPSGLNLTEAQQSRVCDAVRRILL
jgi:perosamine synthetase